MRITASEPRAPAGLHGNADQFAPDPAVLVRGAYGERPEQVPLDAGR